MLHVLTRAIHATCAVRRARTLTVWDAGQQNILLSDAVQVSALLLALALYAIVDKHDLVFADSNGQTALTTSSIQQSGGTSLSSSTIPQGSGQSVGSIGKITRTCEEGDAPDNVANQVSKGEINTCSQAREFGLCSLDLVEGACPQTCGRCGSGSGYMSGSGSEPKTQEPAQPKVCERDLSCFDAEFPCIDCCVMGQNNRGEGCWQGDYTQNRCCAGG